jgi:dihydrodipicolinate synthase/N-acetylneuraminate lyase
MCIYSTTLPELGFYVHADLVARLAEIDTVCAVKEASLSLSLFSATMMAAGDLLAVSCPIEEYQFYGAATFGFDVVPAFLLGNSRPLYAAAPCQRFASAMEGENLAEAAVALREILAVSNSLHSRYLTDGKHNVALTKYLTSLVGMAAGPVRPPLTDAPEEQKAEARGVLIAAGLLSDADPAAPAAAPAPTSGR